MLKYLKELLAKREQARAKLGEKASATEDVKELRSINAQILELNSEIEDLRANIKSLEEEEEKRAAAEKEDLENQRRNGAREQDKSEFRSVVKHVLGKEMTAEERADIKTTDNAAIIPKQFVNKLIEIQKGYGSLKGLCDIIPVTKNEGTIPVIDLDQNEMLDVAEGEDIVDGTLVTTDVPFKCAKVGLIQSLTSELIDDAEIEIESLVNKNFANIATAKENFKILKVVKDNATLVTGATSYEDVEKAIDGSLPAVKAGLVTLTNVTGYVHLKNMKDKEGRPLNLITEINGVEYFHGKPIVHVEDTLLPITELKTQVFYVLNMNEAVKYCDRKAVTVAKSTEAGFRDDTVKIRILERFIPVLGSKRSIKKIEF